MLGPSVHPALELVSTRSLRKAELAGARHSRCTEYSSSCGPQVHAAAFARRQATTIRT